MRMLCDSWNVGYSQPNRWNIYDGGETDCSASTAWSYNQAGIAPPFPHTIWTGTWRNEAVNRGFTSLAWTANEPVYVGDLLLYDSSSRYGHIAMITGPDLISEAAINEFGEISGGRTGDQTGGETSTRHYSTHPRTVSGRWNTILRPPGSMNMEDDMPGLTTPIPTIGNSQYQDVLAAIDTRVRDSEAMLKQILPILQGIVARTDAANTRLDTANRHLEQIVAELQKK